MCVCMNTVEPGSFFKLIVMVSFTADHTGLIAYVWPGGDTRRADGRVGERKSRRVSFYLPRRGRNK